MHSDDSKPCFPQDIPPSVFLGYCVKKYEPTLQSWRERPWTAEVTEVCSASDCLTSRPAKWIDSWDFNRASCWNDEATALARVAPEEQGRYLLYAYRAVPLVFGTSGVPDRLMPDALFAAMLPELPPEPRPFRIRLSWL